MVYLLLLVVFLLSFILLGLLEQLLNIAHVEIIIKQYKITKFKERLMALT